MIKKEFFPSLLLSIIFVLVIISNEATAQIIPAERKIDWDPGTRTDHRERSTIFMTLSPGGGDDTPAIQNAIDNCPEGEVVILEEGVFSISSTIEISSSNITLRGSGKDKTILKGTSNFSGSYFFDISSGADLWYSQPSINLHESSLSKGSTKLQTLEAHGWSSGDYVLIDQMNDMNADPPWDDYGYYGECNWCSREDGERLMGQVVKVTVIDDHNVTINPPLYYDYNIDKLPQGTMCAGIVESVSVESLKIDNMSSQAGKTFGLFFVFNSLFYDLDLAGIGPSSGSRHFWFYGTLWNTIKHCDIHTAISDDTNNGYGIFLGLGSSANLIEDNIFHSVVLAAAFEGSNSGNVFAYNYTVNSVWYDPYPNRLMVLGHGGGSGMNLIEGNYIEGRFRSDAGFGTQHYFTVMRNRIEQQPGKSDQVCTFDLEQGQLYCNAVGNVLGTTGYETEYEHENSDVSLSTRVIYRLGYEDPYDNNAGLNDGRVKKTFLRHGNWDAVTDGVVWDEGITDRNLPPSCYLDSKPDFFGSMQWPPIGPDVQGYASAIPAKVRFEGGTVNINNYNADLPEDFVLMQNYPNPFNPTTTIKFSIPFVETGHAPSLQIVEIIIYNVLGAAVATLVNENHRPGNYEVIWDASGFPSGVYFYRLTSGNVSITKKMILLR